jgi:ketosteroid isomerase-like protein
LRRSYSPLALLQLGAIGSAAMADAESNRATIRRLYEGLDRHDGEAMASCYAADARFHDPAFGELDGDEVRGMWRMLTGRAEDLSVELAEHDADAETGTAHWIATYTFGPTGRPVVNDIRARFRFKDGQIAEHDDEFDFGLWAKQALGPPLGNLISLIPPMAALPRKRARAQLDEYMAKQGKTPE